MDVTFLLHLNVQDVATISDVAADIEDDLLKAGHDVLSVAPWARSSTIAPTVFSTSTLGSLNPPPTEPPNTFSTEPLS